MSEDHQRGRVRLEQGHKRVRAYLAGELVCDGVCKRHSPRRYTHQHHGVECAMAFDDLVREAQRDAPQPSRIEQLRAVVELLNESAHHAPVT